MPDPIPVRVARKSLIDKGFRGVERDHSLYIYYNKDGQKTQAYTFFSKGGKKAKEIDNALLGRMKQQLRLQTIRQASDLLECPMGRDEFEEALLRSEDQRRSGQR